ncbi:MAG: FtsX-like permease family protein [Promethearchaeota archaeon]
MMIGIIISITLVSGVVIASNRIAFHMLQSKIDQTKVDYAVISTNSNSSWNLDKINSLSGEIEEFITSYEAGYVPFEDIIIQPNENEIQWDDYFKMPSQSRDQWTNDTHFIGLSQDIFENEEIAQRYVNSLTFSSSLELSKPGVYMNLQYAQRCNYSVGQFIALHLAYVDFSYDYETATPQRVNVSITIPDIPILGFFNLSDIAVIDNFHPFHNTISASRNSVFLLGNLTYIKNSIHTAFLTQLEAQYQEINKDNAYYYQRIQRSSGDFSIIYGVIIDHSALLNTDPNRLEKRFEYIRTRIYNIGEGEFTSVISLMGQELSEISQEILIYEVFFIAITIPVLILGWFLCKINWDFSYQQRRHEMAMLKVRGGKSQELKQLFYLEAGIIGFFGGILGIFGGIISSSLVVNWVFPDVVNTNPWYTIWEDISVNQTMMIGTGIGGIIGGVIISVLAVKEPLNIFLKKLPVEGLAKFNETIQNSLPIRKNDVILLIVGVIPFALIPLLKWGLLQEIFEWRISLAPFISLFTALMPFASFLTIYACIRLICRNRSFFQKMIRFIGKLFPKRITAFTSKGILNNQARSFRVVFIITISLSFIVMNSILVESEMRYQNELAIIETGGGLRISYQSQELETFGINSTLTAVIDEQNSLGYGSFIYSSAIRDVFIPGTEQVTEGIIPIDDVLDIPFYGMTAIPSKNFSQHIDFQDRWFNGAGDDSLVEMLAEDKFVIIPQKMVDLGYLIGTFLTVSYLSIYSSTKHITLKIIGSYDAFPVISSRISIKNVLVIDEKWIEDASIQDFDVVFYPPQGQFLDELDTFQYTEFFWNLKSPDSYVKVIYPTNDIVESISQSSISFFKLESYYLMSLVLFGIMVIMYISIREKASDIGVMRARGVPKRVLYKIQLVEGFTLILFSLIFSVFGIFGAMGLLFQLNHLDLLQIIDMQYLNILLERTIVIPWWKLLIELTISIILFTVSILIAVRNVIKKSNIGNIGNLLRIAS